MPANNLGAHGPTGSIRLNGIASEDSRPGHARPFEGRGHFAAHLSPFSHGEVGCVLVAWRKRGTDGPGGKSPTSQKAAPEFVRTDLKHRRLDLRDYRGKIVLLNFWATWCAPCRLEMPRFVAWQTQYGSCGTEIIGISMDDDSSAARGLCKKLRVNYPVAMGDEKLGRLYGGVLGLPLTFPDRQPRQSPSSISRRNRLEFH